MSLIVKHLEPFGPVKIFGGLTKLISKSQLFGGGGGGGGMGQFNKTFKTGQNWQS